VELLGGRRLTDLARAAILPAAKEECQLLFLLIAASSSRHAVSFSSASTMKRFPAMRISSPYLFTASQLPPKKTARPMSYTDRAEALPCRALSRLCRAYRAAPRLNRDTPRLIGPRKYYYGLLETKFQPTTTWRGKRLRRDSRDQGFSSPPVREKGFSTRYCSRSLAFPICALNEVLGIIADKQ
jgi:hypothetical protein